jgi:hypothetical protein
MDSLCLGVVLFSYAGKLCWGFTGEWDLLPDLHDFVEDVEASFRELSAIPARIEISATLRAPGPAKRKRMRRPARLRPPDRLIPTTEVAALPLLN